MKSSRLEGINPETPPEIVGRYVLHAPIASGGMATVHFGRILGDVGFSRPVAIKRLHPQFANDPKFRAMFLNEAKVAARIRHSNVVPTLDVVATDSQLLIVMEYVHGEALSRLGKMCRGRCETIPIPIVLAIVCNVLHGLHAAHEAKSETGEPLHVVHRDVSPHNIIVGTDGVARLFDFGIARASSRFEHTREGVVKGKVAYMPPEQLGGGQLSPQTDIFAAAVILWELLTGQRLFYDEAKQSILYDRLLRGNLPKPSDVRPDVSPELDGLIGCALSRQPRERFTSARQFALALEQLGALATASEVGYWVNSTAASSLEVRSLRLAEFESSSVKLMASPATSDHASERLAMESGTHRLMTPFPHLFPTGRPIVPLNGRADTLRRNVATISSATLLSGTLTLLIALAFARTNAPLLDRAAGIRDSMLAEGDSAAIVERAPSCLKTFWQSFGRGRGRKEIRGTCSAPSEMRLETAAMPDRPIQGQSK